MHLACTHKYNWHTGTHLADACEAVVEPLVGRQEHELVQIVLLCGLARRGPNGGVHAQLRQVAGAGEAAAVLDRIRLLFKKKEYTENDVRTCLKAEDDYT